MFILSIIASVSSSFYWQLVLCVENPALIDVCRQPREMLIAVAEGLLWLKQRGPCYVCYYIARILKLTETTAHLGRLTR